MLLHLIRVPYDSSHHATRMGAGPDQLVARGAPDMLRAAGHTVRESVIHPASAWRAEVRTAFELDRALAERVAGSVGAGERPIVLAGNCITSVGTVAGLALALGGGEEASGARAREPGESDDPRIGVVWLDAHGDLNTPETSPGGFLDGMALAILTGRCWRPLAGSVPGFRAVPDRRVVLVGAPDLDPPEAELLAHSGIARVGLAAVRSLGVRDALAVALDQLAGEGVERVYLHIDLDVHDSAEARANEYPRPAGEGLTAASVRELVRVVAGRFRLGAAALTAYDPAFDPDGRTADIALELMRHIADT
ncbi:MAG: arginase family protein [Gemmatimonadaceae bacterium]